jgi:hypothetical protein
MKRKNSRYRQISLQSPAAFIRPGIGHQANRATFPFATGQRGRRSQKIFVVKQMRYVASTTGANKKVRRILIFDNHPDSLRLVFALGANSCLDVGKTSDIKTWQIAFLCLLLTALCIAMFWPLF